jgi:hypothetical protein
MTPFHARNATQRRLVVEIPEKFKDNSFRMGYSMKVAGEHDIEPMQVH